jgi:UDP-glucose 4-epimerase
LKRILLSGGFGYIGSHTAVALADAGFNVVLFDNLSNSKRDVLDRLETITGIRFPFIEGDVRDTALLEETLHTHQIDSVVHFAGLKAVGESVEAPLSYYENNVVGTAERVNLKWTVCFKLIVNFLELPEALGS